MKTDAQNSLPPLIPDWLNPKKSGDFRFFLIIVTAIIVALIGFTVGRNAWNSHQAAVAREQAAMAEQAREAERQAQLEQMKREAEQQQAAKQQAEQRQAQYKDPLAQLSQVQTDLLHVKDGVKLNQERVEYFCNERPAEGSCDRNKYWLTDSQKKLEQKITEYNVFASKIPCDVLDYAKYPDSYDSNGNAVESTSCSSGESSSSTTVDSKSTDNLPSVQQQKAEQNDGQLTSD